MNVTALEKITNSNSQDGVSSGSDSGSGSGSNATGSCSQIYTGRHCLSALKSLQECLSGDDTVTDIFISNNIADQLQHEDEIGKICATTVSHTLLNNHIWGKAMPWTS